MKAVATSLLLGVCIGASAQDWTQRMDLAGPVRWGASGFGIGTTGYICGGTNGSTNYTDLWAWDQVTDTWLQRADFPGDARREGIGFAIGGIGYYGFGRTGVGQPGYNDLWAYDPVLNTWEQRASLPGVGRSTPSAFILDGKAYMLGGNPQSAPYLTELWEYDPVADAWMQHADLPATGRSGPVAFALNGKGYVGSGNDNSANYACSDHWQWDPAQDQWTQLGDMPGPERRTACYFPFEDLPIVGGGWDGTTYFTDFHAYHATTDSWSPVPDFEGVGAHTPVSFNVNDRGYVGTGGIPGGQTGQYWEFDKGVLSNVSDAGTSALQAMVVIVEQGAITLSGWSTAIADRYTVYDASGRRVVQGTLRSAVIEIEELSTGHYLLQLTNAKGEQRVHAFVTVLN